MQQKLQRAEGRLSKADSEAEAWQAARQSMAAEHKAECSKLQQALEAASRDAAAVKKSHAAELAQVRARLYANNHWSPITSANFIVGAAPASAANLVISEVCYKPVAVGNRVLLERAVELIMPWFERSRLPTLHKQSIDSLFLR